MPLPKTDQSFPRNLFVADLRAGIPFINGGSQVPDGPSTHKNQAETRMPALPVVKTAPAPIEASPTRPQRLDRRTAGPRTLESLGLNNQFVRAPNELRGLSRSKIVAVNCGSRLVERIRMPDLLNRKTQKLIRKCSDLPVYLDVGGYGEVDQRGERRFARFRQLTELFPENRPATAEVHVQEGRKQFGLGGRRRSNRPSELKF